MTDEQIKLTSLTPEYVQNMPKDRQHGVLYISKLHSMAIHKCPCGCGFEAVTPLECEAMPGWTLQESSVGVSLHPSVYNKGLPCQSHYYITDNQVRWC